MYDPETANRVEKIRNWNSEVTDPPGITSVAPESLVAAAYLGPLHNPDGLMGLMEEDPSAKLLCKAVALVATVVDYKSLLCLLVYTGDPNTTAADITKSIEQVVQHLNIDEFIRIMHHFVILNSTSALEGIITEAPPRWHRIVGVILEAGLLPLATTQPTIQPTIQPTNCPQQTQQPSWMQWMTFLSSIASLALIALVLIVGYSMLKTIKNGLLTTPPHPKLN